MKQTLKSLVLVAFACSLSAPALAADIVIGVPNWPSVRATANILKVVLEDNLGVEVELQNGTNPIIFEAMDSGSMQVHPEVWLPNQQNLHDTYVGEKGTVVMNPNGVEAFNGYCVTEHTANVTGIQKLSDLTDPEMAANFDTDGDGLGEVWIGASGWASTPIEKIRAKSYGFSETMTLKEMDEALAMAEVDNAVVQNKPIVFMCYTPNHVFSLHNLVVLEEPEYDASKWTIIQPTDDPEWLEKSSAGVAWDVAYLHIHYAASLEDTYPEAASLLSNVQFDTDTISAMSYALVVDQQDPAEFARNWVAENSDQVDSWLK